MPPASAPPASVALLTLGCARNEVDSEELAARLAADGFRLVDDPDSADVAVVNTCGFVEAAKKDSIDALLELAGPGRPVVAVGCLAERYGDRLARELPEAAAVLGFDDYADIADRLRDVLGGHAPAAHVPRDRRRLLPVAPAARASAATTGTAAPWRPGTMRRRLDGGPMAPLKIAGGCDRRCAFCAIPAFRGAFVSRRPADLLAEASWLARHGVRELYLVSENSTSYGKDLGDLRLLESLLAQLATVDGVARVRVSYLQPAEVRASLLDALTMTPGVVPYFDLSFQHASAGVLRRMRRFGGSAAFLDLLDEVRARCPSAGVRSNVIVGFPGETEEDLAELEDFLGRARLDAVGVFAYSDEDGTEAATLPGKVEPDEVAARASRALAVVDELGAQRAEDRVGETVDVLVDTVVDEGAGGAPERATVAGGSGAGVWRVEGRAAHQGPDDASTVVSGSGQVPSPGDLLAACVVAAAGADLAATALPATSP